MAEGTSEKLLTPANVVTLLRICFVPVFVVAIISPWPTWFPTWEDADLWKPWIAALIFVVLAATDGVDGYLARSRSEVTTFGKFVDPLADKILVSAALLALVELRVLPSWVVLIIIAREFIVSGVRMIAASKGQVIAASWYGKAKTVSQIIAIVLFIIKDSEVLTSVSDVIHDPLYIISWIAMTIAVVLTLISMMDYLSKSRELLGFKPSKKKPVKEATKPSIEFDVPPELSRLASKVIEAASVQGKTIATAESLTGGLIAAALTSVPGSSVVVKGSIVSYTNEVKHVSLNVSEDTLVNEGSVSAPCAEQMAVGASQELSSGLAVSVTGIAGPGGDEPCKPVGTVFMGLYDEGKVSSMRFQFKGSRAEVRAQTAQVALQALLDALA